MARVTPNRTDPDPDTTPASAGPGRAGPDRTGWADALTYKARAGQPPEEAPCSLTDDHLDLRGLDQHHQEDAARRRFASASNTHVEGDFDVLIRLW